MTFTDSMTLAEARDLLRSLVDAGARCPCCTQTVKVYRRPLSHVAARTLIALYQHAGDDYAHVPTLLAKHLPDIAHQGGYATLSAHWKLIEEAPVRRDDNGRAGCWRITKLGRSFVRNWTTVPKYAHIYDGRLLRLSGPPITIDDALGTKFSYAELMGAEHELRVEEQRINVSPAPVVVEGSAGIVNHNGWADAPPADPPSISLFDTTPLEVAPAPRNAIQDDWKDAA